VRRPTRRFLDAVDLLVNAAPGLVPLELDSVVGVVLQPLELEVFGIFDGVPAALRADREPLVHRGGSLVAGVRQRDRHEDRVEGGERGHRQCAGPVHVEDAEDPVRHGHHAEECLRERADRAFAGCHPERPGREHTVDRHARPPSAFGAAR
jgi:hypothetical protein